KAVLTLDGVVVVTRVPDERVVACAHQGNVVAVAAVEQIVAFAAQKMVFAETAVHRQLHYAGLETCRVDDVATAEPVDDERVVRDFRVRYAHERGEAEDRD